MQKMRPQEGESANVVADNIERLKELFPDAFSDSVAKTNTAAILEQNGINHVRSL